MRGTFRRKIFSWRQHHVPVIGHPLIGDQVDRLLLRSLVGHPLKGFVVGVFVEDRYASIASVEDIVDLATNIGTRRSRHR